ncbi:MAG: NUDIX hydrolase [Chloroflexi bacterium]|nr:NUDIX hydrolase [Ardenticatenaceae bacterium]MBL1127973.1 NUDIX hydrolase [Chloroflexota bacterium]NOG34045.1 NUDIX hydrolase [Chloroflexota bacterium]GIK54463.1 MAG: NUDIX hydrolase [Chloroflexota bacterium]
MMNSVEPYDPTKYERPSVTVDVVVFSLVADDLKVLLVRRKTPPFSEMWAIPGAFVRLDESLAAAATRALVEETGVEDVYTEQLYTFGDPNRDPRMRVITVAYFALVPYDAVRHAPGRETSETGWFSMFHLPPLAFDHHEILEYALTRLRYKLEYTAVGFQLLPDVFTLTELQKAYEIILQEKLDKRNFRRKILSAAILEETGQKRQEGEGRPAMLYKYREDAVAEVKTRRLFP